MKLLLDTHIVLWAVLDDPRLPTRLRDALGTAELFVSAASVWEVAIKTGLGKLDVPETLWDNVRAAGVTPLPVTWVHAQGVRALPAHHNDPFDRLLIAQALAEGHVLASLDTQIARYDVDVLGR
jgi:PIN domain nuclease of toxin-antitoxin system